MFIKSLFIPSSPLKMLQKYYQVQWLQCALICQWYLQEQRFCRGANSDEPSINRSSQTRFCYLCCWQLSVHTGALITFLQSAKKTQHLSADRESVPSGSSIIPNFSSKQFPSKLPFSTTSRKEGMNIVRKQSFWEGLSGILNPLWSKKNVILPAPHHIGMTHI